MSMPERSNGWSTPGPASGWMKKSRVEVGQIHPHTPEIMGPDPLLSRVNEAPKGILYLVGFRAAFVCSLRNWQILLTGRKRTTSGSGMVRINTHMCCSNVVFFAQNVEIQNKYSVTNQPWATKNKRIFLDSLFRDGWNKMTWLRHKNCCPN